MKENKPLLQLNHISKRYGDLIANEDISLSVHAGTIHALLGENGAGKSTLMNIVYGLVSPDKGEIRWQGEKVIIHSPMVAKALGIGIVFQHFALFPSLSILENIALGIDYKGKQAQLYEEVQAITTDYQLDITDVHQYISELSAGEKQRVEIIRCLMQKPKLLILDEPTSVLTPTETKRLFKTLHILKQKGCAVVFIGHKLEEIKAICETATIIRKGHLIGHYPLAQTDMDTLVEMMVGNQVSPVKTRKHHNHTKVILQLNHNGCVNFSKYDKNTHHSTHQLQLKSGTITGLAGIAGNGQDQLMAYLAGEITGNKHSIQYWHEENPHSEGSHIGDRDNAYRKKQGIIFVPTERLGRSTVVQMNLVDNAFLGVANSDDYCQYGGLIQRSKTHALSEQIITQYDVHPPNKEASAQNFSGGNLQKYIIGRAILQHPKVLLISNPTWGVDINAATFIRNQLITLRDNGVAIFIASEDLDEMFTLCDEITVIKKHQLGHVQPIKEISIEQVGALMMT